MRKLSVLVFVSLVLAAVTPALSDVQFYDDCEDYPNLTTDWGLTQNGGQLTVSTEQKRAGSHSFKFSFSPNQGKRVELVLRKSPFKNWQYNTEYWLGYSIFIPSNFTPATGYGVISQWHKAGDNACDQLPRPENPAVAQPLGISIVGTSEAPIAQVQITAAPGPCGPAVGGYSVSKKYNSPPFKKGAWNDVVVHVKFNYDRSGINNVWLNGVKFVSTTPANAHNDPLPPYLKLGFYGTSTIAHTVYFDEIRVASTNSSYDEVAPRGANNSIQTILEPPKLEIISNN